MNILFFHSGADLYGASRSFLRLATRLSRDGHKIKTIIPSSGPLFSELKRQSIDVEIFEPFPIIERRICRNFFTILTTIFDLPLAISRICRLIDLFRPDIIHSNTSVIIAPAIAARMMHIPHIWHIRETFVEFGVLWKIYQRILIWGSTRIISVSKSVAEQFHEGSRSKISILHNGIPEDEFEPISQSRIDFFKKTYSIENKLVVGFIGRIKFIRKGQEYLVQAASFLKGRYPHVIYLIIGSPFPGNEHHLYRLRKLIEMEGLSDQFIITGDVPDIKAAYSALDISVMASGMPEPFAGVTIESMAMGKPMIGTTMGGTVEQIDDGITGIMIPAQNPHALADALSQMIEDPEMRKRMGNAGRIKFLNSFTFPLFYTKLLAIYQKAA